jgi:GH43 family beta-xylosidase
VILNRPQSFPWHVPAAIVASFVVVAAISARAAEVTTLFVNPVLEGADPWVVKQGNDYVWCLSEGNRAIAVHVSPRLTAPGSKQIVWRAPDSGPVSREVWAPEIHFADGRWYIYFAASDGKNRNHLAYVLQSESADPRSAYTLHGPLYTGDDPALKADNRWAIDFTLLEHRGRRYGIWSGWLGEADDMQHLFIAPLTDPLHVAAPRVKLCPHDDFVWERTEEKPGTRGLNEAPQVLKRGARTFLTYSAAASWLPTYKLGMLELVGADPLDPASWKKLPEPVFRSTETTYGVGHASFVASPDGTEDWIVFHAKRDRNPGWRRAVFLQPFRWTADGLPEFGQPAAAGTSLPLPSGEQAPVPQTEEFTASFKDTEAPAGWSYFGHHQLITPEADGLHLGRAPQGPVNLYRCGEKLVLDGGRWTDADITARLRVVDGDRDAGILFRASQPAVGYDAHRGYFAGIIPGANRVILGLADGTRWRELARANAEIARNRDYTLAVKTRGPRITVLLDNQPLIETTDAAYSTGTIGLRVVDTHAAFESVRVEVPGRGKSN